MQFIDAVAVTGTRRLADGYLVAEAHCVRTRITGQARTGGLAALHHPQPGSLSSSVSKSVRLVRARSEQNSIIGVPWAGSDIAG